MVITASKQQEIKDKLIEDAIFCTIQVLKICPDKIDE